MLLKDFIDFNPKESLSKDFYKKISMDQLKPFQRYINSDNYEMFSGGSKFRNGDTIMARITPCLENGKTAYVNCLASNEVAFGSTEFIVARAKKGISLPLFIYYLLCSTPIRKTAILSMTGSSGRERVQQFMLDNYEIPDYSLEFQQHIVDTIGSVDNLIEKYQEVINQANRYSKLIIDKIPQEKTLQLKDFIDINTGKLNANQSDENGIYPFFTCSENKSFINTYAFDCEAILVSGNGSQLGYTNYYQGKFNAYQRTYVLTGSKWFYIWYYALKFNIHKITSQAIGSAIPYLTKPMFEDFKIDVYQDDNINNALNENLKQITNLIFKMQYKIESLEKAKKQLLNKYFG